MTFTTNSLGERSSSSVWSRNTNYTGAAGIHNECGRGTQARGSTLQKSHSSRVNTMSQQHKKEMRLLQNSMLAYTQKMQKLSLEKFPSELCRGRRDSSEKAESLREVSILSRVSETSAGSYKSQTRTPTTSPVSEHPDDVIPPLNIISRFPSLDNVSDVTSVRSTRSRLSLDSAFASSRSSNASSKRKETGGVSRNSAWTPSPRRSSLQNNVKPRKAKRTSEDQTLTLLDLDHHDEVADVADSISTRDSGRYSHASNSHQSGRGPLLGDAMEIIAHPERLVPPILIEESGLEWSDCSIDSFLTAGKQKKRTKTKAARPARGKSGKTRGDRKSTTSTPRLPAIGKRVKRGPKAPRSAHRRFRYSEAVASSINKRSSNSSEAEWDDSEDPETTVLTYMDPEDFELARSSLRRDEDELVDKSGYFAPERCSSVLSPSPDSDESPRSNRKSVLRKASSTSTITSSKKSVHFFLDDD